MVVETIEFTVTDTEANLPLPMTLRGLENLKILQKKASIIFETDEVEQELQIVIHESTVQDTSTAKEEITSTTKKIRTDYVSKGRKNFNFSFIVGKLGVSESTQICPRCGISVKVSEMEEHVRIELLDPKWRQQKAVFESRIKDSNLIIGKEDISKNLARLSDHRSDIFGTGFTEDSKKLIEKEKKISSEKSKNIWDGSSASVPKALKNAQSNVSSPTEKIIGPQIPQIPSSKNIVRVEFILMIATNS